ncbi:hypothetical protein ABID82_007073 [Methylobacterium sp. PvP062]|uniref:Uncharacterized protein n=1 Tax=Methylobacterium radiotolerans TaxID=31998 RepID=A0ABV2NID4_9HYPH|nr:MULTISPECIES: hypothetical protein [unclassified Methylobacterium]MBP2497022.1 hypothetical protein [Methylobacterium sp. PvP105]MBP2503107.1 hypothetical protein [Methylobacterium sp. PvP109]
MIDAIVWLFTAFILSIKFVFIAFAYVFGAVASLASRAWIWYLDAINGDSYFSHALYWAGCAITLLLISFVLGLIFKVFQSDGNGSNSDSDDDEDEDEDEDEDDSNGVRTIREQRRYRPYVTLQDDRYVIKKLSNKGTAWELSIGRKDQYVNSGIARLVPRSTAGGSLAGVRYIVEWGEE